jgi:tetratricopeptide (TPR) repeat protein
MRAALVLACLVGAAHADVAAEARAHYRHGLTLFNEGRFGAAREEFEAGYQLQPLPLFLFNAAQAARRAGDPDRALSLYRQFVAADPQSSLRAEAEQHLAELAPPPSPAPLVVAAPPPAPIPVRWSRDRAGATLTALGAAAAVAGAILVGIGGARYAAAQNSYGSYDSAQKAGPLVISGGVTLGGAIRFGVVARRAHR